MHLMMSHRYYIFCMSLWCVYLSILANARPWVRDDLAAMKGSTKDSTDKVVDTTDFVKWLFFVGRQQMDNLDKEFRGKSNSATHTKIQRNDTATRLDDQPLSSDSAGTVSSRPIIRRRNIVLSLSARPSVSTAAPSTLKPSSLPSTIYPTSAVSTDTVVSDITSGSSKEEKGAGTLTSDEDATKPGSRQSSGERVEELPPASPTTPPPFKVSATLPVCHPDVVRESDCDGAYAVIPALRHQDQCSTLYQTPNSHHKVCISCNGVYSFNPVDAGSCYALCNGKPLCTPLKFKDWMATHITPSRLKCLSDTSYGLLACLDQFPIMKEETIVLSDEDRMQPGVVYSSLGVAKDDSFQAKPPDVTFTRRRGHQRKMTKTGDQQAEARSHLKQFGFPKQQQNDILRATSLSSTSSTLQQSTLLLSEDLNQFQCNPSQSISTRCAGSIENATAVVGALEAVGRFNYLGLSASIAVRCPGNFEYIARDGHECYFYCNGIPLCTQVQNFILGGLHIPPEQLACVLSGRDSTSCLAIDVS